MRRIEIYSDECIGCGQCEEVCRRGAIKFHASHGYARAYIDQELCIKCKCCIHDLDCPGDAFVEVK